MHVTEDYHVDEDIITYTGLLWAWNRDCFHKNLMILYEHNAQLTPCSGVHFCLLQVSQEDINISQTTLRNK
jgi:hypothetical protein